MLQLFSVKLSFASTVYDLFNLGYIDMTVIRDLMSRKV